MTRFCSDDRALHVIVASIPLSDDLMTAGSGWQVSGTRELRARLETESTHATLSIQSSCVVAGSRPSQLSLTRAPQRLSGRARPTGEV
jgi:hypothetical protein